MGESMITDVPGLIRSFYEGAFDIIRMRELYDTHPEINDFLQGVIDGFLASGKPFLPARPGDFAEAEYFRNPDSYPGAPYGNQPFGCVHDYLTQEFRMLTTNVRTASGAGLFFDRLYTVFCQYDPTTPYDRTRYNEAFDFMLDVVPQYLEGGAGEIYIQEHIIPQYPDTMKKGERKKAVKAAIKEAFKSEKGYPAWLQSSEWPLGKDGKPATYLGKKKTHGGEAAIFRFRDESDGSEIQVEQWY